MTKADSNEKAQRGPRPVVGYLLVVLAALLFFAALAKGLAASWEPALFEFENLGELGDFIGGVLNPITAGVALYLLWKTYALQKQELAETRDELKRSRIVAQTQLDEALLFKLIEQFRLAEERIHLLCKSRGIPLNGSAAVDEMARWVVSKPRGYALSAEGLREFSDQHKVELHAMDAFAAAFVEIYRVIRERWPIKSDYDRYARLCKALLGSPAFHVALFWTEHRDSDAYSDLIATFFDVVAEVDARSSPC